LVWKVCRNKKEEEEEKTQWDYFILFVL
jgi:hypothetical protein